MIDVTVKNILFFSQAAAPGYTLFLQPMGDDSRSLPIVVGQFEAQAIALALEQVRLQRPMTHDLLSTVIDSLTDGLESVVINELKAGTFYAQMYIRQGDKFETIDSRPSDAIALALRANVPIRVTEAIFKEASVVVPLRANTPNEVENSFSKNLRDITREAELRFDLEKDLREAISREDYEQAAQIRDRLHTLSS
ncbi:bifunctional nuclease family protein [bacterium]|nr:bifunctional nuclease family protein [bacterium]